MNRLVVMRASHVAPDPRVARAAAVADDTGLTVEVLGWDRSGDQPTDERQQHYTIRRFRRLAEHGRGLPNLLGLILFQWFLICQTCRRRRGLVAIHASDLSTGLTALLLSRLLRVPLIYDVFDYYADSFPVPHRLRPAVRRLETFVLEHADEVILPASTRAAQIAPARPRRLTIVENSPDLANRPSEMLPNTDLGYVGILAEGRLLSEIVDAVAADPTLSLRIAGFGPLENEIAATAERTSNIEYLGRVDSDRALQVLASSTVMFATYDPEIPNHRYSAPNKFAEALALGKPLIVCADTSIDLHVRQTGLGKVIGYDVQEFMRAAHDVIDDQTLLRHCAVSGPRLYHAEHSWPANAGRLRQVFERLGPYGTGA